MRNPCFFLIDADWERLVLYARLRALPDLLAPSCPILSAGLCSISNRAGRSPVQVLEMRLPSPRQRPCGRSSGLPQPRRQWLHRGAGVSKSPVHIRVPPAVSGRPCVSAPPRNRPSRTGGNPRPRPHRPGRPGSRRRSPRCRRRRRSALSRAIAAAASGVSASMSAKVSRISR